MNFALLTNILFPAECISCRRGVRDGALCATCMDKILFRPILFCGSCRKRLPCMLPSCHPDTPYLFGAAGSYHNKPLKDLIHGLKFNFMRSAADPIGDVLGAALAKIPIDIRDYTVTSLPLSKRRERLRGFNQSTLIARRAAALVGLPFQEGFIVRTKHRKPQSETQSIAEREKNIKGCFVPTTARAAKGKNIILIDDVTTSGATFHAASAALHHAGAKTVIALAAAHA